jgi:4-hydroxy-tetrahydrodipicolinate synthase
MPAFLDLARLDTVQLALPTPFTADGSRVVPEVLAGHVHAASAAGITVFLPAAGTGEFHSLTVEEVLTCVSATRSASPSGVVYAPVGGAIGNAVQLARCAAETGADALLVMPLTHPYRSDAGYRDYFRAIADGTPLPLLAYKKEAVPSERLLLELGETGRLVGVKYAVNDLDAFTRFADACRGRLRLFCGSGERYAPFFLMAGAAGFTSGAANFCPRLSLGLQQASAGGRLAESLHLLQNLRRIEDYRAREGESYSISMIKYGLRLCGRDFGPPRPPQRRLTEEEETEIRWLLEPILAAEAQQTSPTSRLAWPPSVPHRG